MGKRKRRGRNRNRAGGYSQRPDKRFNTYLTVDTADGTKIIRSTVKTEEEAEAWLTKMKYEYARGFNFDADRMTFGEYLLRWLEDEVRMTAKETTYLAHRGRVRTHLAPALGHIFLNKLTPAHFQSLYSEKLKTLTPSTVIGIHSTARKSLAQALRWDLVAKNAAANARPPKLVKAQVRWLDKAQARRFLEAAKEKRLYALYALALATGARHGELLALSWDDISFSEDESNPSKSNPLGARISIRGTYSRSLPKREGGEGYTISSTKTGSGRVVSVGADTAQVLREHRKRQAEERLKSGPLWTETGYVFTTMKGTRIHITNSAKYFRALRDEAGFEGLRFHDLRHTMASIAGLDRVPAYVVQRRLGHAKISQTMDTYSHVFDESHQEAADRMDSSLFG